MPQQSVAPTSTSVTTSPASPNDDPSENMITSSYGVLHDTVRKMNISNLLFYTIYTYSILLIINQYYRLTWSSIMMIKQDCGRWGIYIYIVLHIKSIVMYLKKMMLLIIAFPLITVWFVFENMCSGRWFDPTFCTLPGKAELFSMPKV